ncbi:hypothetical protein GCM10010282_62950 [Streptomyces roseolus]|nr:hypothetical protein GCM10010282_62950 [Streptomyces roseolus]
MSTRSRYSGEGSSRSVMPACRAYVRPYPDSSLEVIVSAVIARAPRLRTPEYVVPYASLRAPAPRRRRHTARVFTGLAGSRGNGRGGMAPTGAASAAGPARRQAPTDVIRAGRTP